jgi:hypothetical protein
VARPNGTNGERRIRRFLYISAVLSDTVSRSGWTAGDDHAKHVIVLAEAKAQEQTELPFNINGTI